MHTVDMTLSMLTRRKMVLATIGWGLPAVSFLPGCRASLPPLSVTASTSDADALLMQSAEAHGASEFSKLHDVNVAYVGKWHSLVGKLQPTLVDSGFRGASEERMLLGDDLVGQTHTGPKGSKHVVRRAQAKEKGEVRVWFNGEETQDVDRRAAAALVADAYGIFLFGPMLIAKYRRAGREFLMEVTGVEQIMDGARRYDCDVLRIRMQPGIGLSDADQLALYIERGTHLMRRVRFSLDGLESTRGALVDVDTLDPVTIRGVQWPTRFHEKLLRPAPLQVHDWRLVGIDIDRGIDSAEISGSVFTGKAVAAAALLRG